MNIYSYNRRLLKNKIRSSTSFFNFFLRSNTFDFTVSMNPTNMNFNNKYFLSNFFSQFNIGSFFCKKIFYYYNFKATFSINSSFTDFINLNKSFMEEASIFNNYTSGLWKMSSVYSNSFAFDIISNFRTFFFNGFGITNLFIFLFNSIRFLYRSILFLYSLFFNFFFSVIYLLK